MVDLSALREGRVDDQRGIIAERFDLTFEHEHKHVNRVRLV
jgi:hypothetical protein